MCSKTNRSCSTPTSRRSRSRSATPAIVRSRLVRISIFSKRIARSNSTAALRSACISIFRRRRQFVSSPATREPCISCLSAARAASTASTISSTAPSMMNRAKRRRLPRCASAASSHPDASAMTEISRREHASLFGPTTGDRIRLGDTDLYIEIERDLRGFGDEVVFGGGKSIREGMGFDNTLTSADGAPDLVITNVTIVDAVLGVVKADVGIKHGLICGIGKAGNPQTMDGITPSLALGNATDALSGEHCILTGGGVDTHIHFVSPQQIYAGLSNGVTTFIGGGIGPTDGTNATTVTSGPWNIGMMLRAAEGLPVNIGFLGKGHAHGTAPLVEQIQAGAIGFKCHEDWGTTPAVIRSALAVADELDVQVSIHTDTLNESGFVEDTIAAFEGRTIHTFHTEGSGGGHSPDIIRVAGESNVLPSSTNPTLPYGVNTQAELFDMIMVCHNLNSAVASDVAFAESRVRAETIAAENVLHDMGVI